ncbi:GGDEF domain-containing protein [Clostridiales bacterium COT073_COT-073]|nr:GGDEF domain-containing protein [Clostridiales bacterium COT073_COT-073]
MNKRQKQDITFWQSCIVVFALFIIVFLILSYWEYRRFLHHEMEHNFSQTEVKAELARQWVAERYEQFSILADVFSVAELNYQKIKLFQGFEAVDQEIYRKLYYVDRNFNTVDSNGLGSVSSEEFAKIFEKVKESKHSLLTKVEFYQDTNEPVFSVIAPIRNELEELKGILVGVISLNPLQSYLNNAGFHSSGEGDESSTWILNSEKQTILHNNQEMILNFRLDHGEDFGYKNIDQLGDLIDKNISGTIRYTIKNEGNLFLSFVKTKINDGWVIMVGRLEISYWEFLSHSWMWKVLLILAAAGLVIAWQEHMRRKISDPINQLKNSLMAFNAGSRHFTIGSKQTVESAELADEIRKVTDTVVAQSYNVESLIRERTKALSDLNTTIAAKNKELSEINASLSASNYRLQHKATTDMLTQLLNRQEFIALTDSLMQDANRDIGKDFSILFLDLDNFKKYNDNFSHDIGDFVLKSISELIQNNVRAMDVSARYGGDEFVILINHPELQAAVSTAERILIKIQEVNGYAREIGEILGEEVQIPIENQLSCSIGVVHYSGKLNMTNAEELMTLADDMMYQAKKAGKGRIEIYEPATEITAAEIK